MIDARARRPLSVTGSARGGVDDDADTDLVYSRDVPARGIRSVPQAPDQRLGAIAGRSRPLDLEVAVDICD
jgi:hypothetical protein